MAGQHNSPLHVNRAKPQSHDSKLNSHPMQSVLLPNAGSLKATRIVEARESTAEIAGPSATFLKLTDSHLVANFWRGEGGYLHLHVPERGLALSLSRGCMT